MLRKCRGGCTNWDSHVLQTKLMAVAWCMDLKGLLQTLLLCMSWLAADKAGYQQTDCA